MLVSSTRGLGYGVAIILLLRLLAAFAGMPQLGLMRFYPHFEGLKLGNAFTHPAISHTLLAGIALCLIGAIVTGVAIDGGDALYQFLLIRTDAPTGAIRWT